MKVQRRFNYTGRGKIKKSDVDIALVEQPGMPPKFEASLRLSGLGLPGNAPVFIEAYQSEIIERFECGTVENPRLPGDTTLWSLDDTRPVRFRVKVADPSGDNGRLLAAAFSITPHGDEPGEEGRESLVTVRTADLGNTPYKLEIPDSGMIQLTANSRIPYAKDRLVQDPVFQSLVFPAIIRGVLYRILLWEDGDACDEDTDEESWQCRWLNFAKRLRGDDSEPDRQNIDAIDSWIEDVVRAFSETHRITDRLVEKLGGGQ
ncbi:MAG: hypothetical protein QME75_12300 [Deltaproteobacteria bacterium]|nr:hypothetical protein [Deltaproteobacteria bacterium]